MEYTGYINGEFVAKTQSFSEAVDNIINEVVSQYQLTIEQHSTLLSLSYDEQPQIDSIDGIARDLSVLINDVAGEDLTVHIKAEGISDQNYERLHNLFSDVLGNVDEISRALIRELDEGTYNSILADLIYAEIGYSTSELVEQASFYIRNVRPTEYWVQDYVESYGINDEIIEHYVKPVEVKEFIIDANIHDGVDKHSEFELTNFDPEDALEY